MGFYAYLLTNILWLQYVWGYASSGGPRAGAGRPGRRRRGRPARSAGRAARYRIVVVPGALVWAAAYLWYAVVGLEPAF